MADVTVIVCLAFDQRAPADGLQKFKDCIVHCPFVDRAMEVCGTFDLIVQGHCSSLAEYTDNMERVRRTTAQFVARLETSFVGRIIDRAGERTRSAALWLPCGDGRKRVESHLIDKIVAEGDYMRSTWLTGAAWSTRPWPGFTASWPMRGSCGCIAPGWFAPALSSA